MSPSAKVAWSSMILLAAGFSAGCGLTLDEGARFDRASQAYAAGDFAAAVVDLKALLQDSPDNIDARLLLGEALFRTRDVAGAEEQFERGTELLLHARETNEATELRPNADAELVDALGKLAALQLALGEFATALSNADFIVTEDPSNIAGYVVASQSAYGLGDNAKSRDYATRLMAQSPENPLAHAMLGFVDAKEGAYAEAETHFYSVLAQQPNHHAVRLALTQLQIAMAKPEAAIATLAPLLVAVPTDPQLLQILDVMRFDSPEARASLDQVAEGIEASNPTSPVPGILRGRSHLQGGEFQTAAEQFQSAMVKGGGRYALIGHYTAQHAAGDPQGAQQALEQWVDRNPSDQIVGFLLAAAYLEQGENDRARTLYERLVGEADADSPVVLNNLAWLYGEIGDPRAIETARQAHDQAPNNAAITDTLGWLLVRAGQYEEGIRMLRLAVDQAPEVEEIRYHLATALAEAGDTGDAQRQIERILRQPTFDPSAIASPASATGAR